MAESDCTPHTRPIRLWFASDGGGNIQRESTKSGCPTATHQEDLSCVPVPLQHWGWPLA
jgi:hypothetical protein